MSYDRIVIVSVFEMCYKLVSYGYTLNQIFDLQQFYLDESIIIFVGI